MRGELVMAAPSRSQPILATPCKHEVTQDCPACAEETIATLKARVAELELWQRANLEVRDIDSARIAELEANERALVSALESSREHIAADADSMTPGWRSAARLVEEINAALSHAGPVARDGER
jgi:hypothetical protein